MPLIGSINTGASAHHGLTQGHSSHLLGSGQETHGSNATTHTQKKRGRKGRPRAGKMEGRMEGTERMEVAQDREEREFKPSATEAKKALIKISINSFKWFLSPQMSTWS